MEQETRKPKLLLVEDAIEFRNNLEIVLRKTFDIHTAGDLETSLNLLEKNHYDIVSTDGHIPKSPDSCAESYLGNTVARKAKEKGIYVIGLSAEPQKLYEPNITLGKASLNLMDYITLLQIHAEKNKWDTHTNLSYLSFHK